MPVILFKTYEKKYTANHSFNGFDADVGLYPNEACPKIHDIGNCNRLADG